MKIDVLKRRIKSKLEMTAVRTARRSYMILGPLTVMVIGILAFCVVQLTIVSFLSPQGKVLRNLNVEKDLLLEENRILEQQIAQRGALGVISHRAEKDLSMKRAGTVVFLTTPSVSADASLSE